MNMPRTLKVRNVTYKIKVLSEKKWKDTPDVSDDEAGITWEASSQIWIRDIPGLSDLNARILLLHEVLHAVTETSEARQVVKWVKRRDVEEAMVALSAPVLLAVLRENPDLVAWLTA